MNYSVPRDLIKYTVEVFVGSIDQVGIYEMKSFVEADNVKLVLTDYDFRLKRKYFTDQWFLGSMKRADTAAVYFEVDTELYSFKLHADMGLKHLYV